MAAYAALALLAWATLTAKFELNGREVPLVWIVWAILALFAVRTYLFDLRTKYETEHRSSSSDSQ